jgi:glutaminase
VSTGHLPAGDRVQAALAEAHREFADVDDGEVADYIPVLAAVDPTLFGMCIASADGQLFEVGDSTQEFSIQSVSKVFVFALLCQLLGPEPAREQLGVNATGQPFNSVVAIELNEKRTINPMVNAGAMVATSLVPGATADEKWATIISYLSRFAGRDLRLDTEVYESEMATNRRNRGIAHLLDGYGRIFFDPEETVDVYTKQCALLVNVRDLAVMGATLADGGVNPLTGEQVIDEANCKHVLSLLAIAGLYEHSGDWLYEVGLPGKSGVSGGIVTIAPGKGGLGTFSPPLDEAGNSVRGQLATKFLSEHLGLNLFASAPARHAAQAAATP